MNISIRVDHTINAPREAVFAFITNPENMTTFTGYGPVPGIKKALVISRPPNREHAGTVLLIENLDGTRHKEKVVLSETPRKLVHHIYDLPKPFSSLVREMEEEWELEVSGEERTAIIRQFHLSPTTPFAFPVAFFIASLIMKKAAKADLENIAKKLKAEYT